MDFNVEDEETGILGLKSSEYSTVRLIRPVNIIDQDHRRRNETIIANPSNNYPKTRCHPRCPSVGFTVVSRPLGQCILVVMIRWM
jgi:hypothetical protein